MSTRRTAKTQIDAITPWRWTVRNLIILAIALCSVAALSPTARAEPRNRVIREAISAFDQGAYAVALPIFQSLANANDAEADYWLGRMYEGGLGVSESAATAIACYRKAAHAGWRDAELRLGEIYLRGTETLQNFAKAHRWLERAALDGNAVAARKVGTLYAKGWGVKKDPIWAYVWYEIAAEKGDDQAPQLRNRLLKTMSESQIAQAQVLTRKSAPEVFGMADIGSAESTG